MMAMSRQIRLMACILTATRVATLNVGGSNNFCSRSRFLSSAAATFITSTIMVGADPARCGASENPRYIDKEVQMSYGDDPDGNPRSRGVFVRRLTGDSTPYQFPVTPVRLVKEWPKEPPFLASDFSRMDEIDDGAFYTLPRLVYHIDEPAVASLTQYYRKNIPKGSAVLDICSSWVSHYPLEFPDIMKRISATGMNPLELKLNDQLTDFEAKDLNKDTKLPYEDNSFDAVTCVVSIDYLTKPIEVLEEVRRVLKPGGKVIISQSNRCFPTKAVRMWLSMNDRQRLELINAYFQYAGGFEPRQAFDITAKVPGDASHDPMFIVEAIKS